MNELLINQLKECLDLSQRLVNDCKTGRELVEASMSGQVMSDFMKDEIDIENEILRLRKEILSVQ